MHRLRAQEEPFRFSSIYLLREKCRWFFMKKMKAWKNKIKSALGVTEDKCGGNNAPTQRNPPKNERVASLPEDAIPRQRDTSAQSWSPPLRAALLLGTAAAMPESPQHSAARDTSRHQTRGLSLPLTPPSSPGTHPHRAPFCCSPQRSSANGAGCSRAGVTSNPPWLQK